MTRHEIVRMAARIGLDMVTGDQQSFRDKLERFANLVAAAEREACAMTVLKIDESGRGSMRDCAQAIRARGQE